uniref:PHB domain-containing protein n=1 Tax=Strongyloides stercoralis TaxID=6248 RepID=A0A0K0EEC7_STRER
MKTLLKIVPNKVLLQNSYRALSNVRNTIVNFVPEQEVWIVERMGKYHKMLKPGLNILLPLIDRVQYVHSLREVPIDIPRQDVITHDNIVIKFEGVLYIRVVDPYKASYGVVDPENAATVLVQTIIRSEISKISHDNLFNEREQLNIRICDAINKAIESWGLICIRHEIKNISMPPTIQEAMQMEVEAERRKRALILESEGKRDAAINIAEGEKKSRILASEADMQEVINQAQSNAKAIEIESCAQKDAIKKIAEALQNNGGEKAAALNIADKYIKTLGKMAKESNTLIVSKNVGDVGSIVGEALTIYKDIVKNDKN